MRQLLAEHVRASYRQCATLPGEQRDRLACVADQGHPPAAPSRNLDLCDLVVVQLGGCRALRLCPGNDPAERRVRRAHGLLRVFRNCRIKAAVHRERGNAAIARRP